MRTHGLARVERREPGVLVLLPPVAQVRRIELPRMSADDARMAIERNVARYFPDAAEPMTVAVQPVRGSRTSWIVAIAPTAVVTAAYEETAKGGVALGAVVPAQAAWAGAAGEGAVTVRHGDVTWRLEVARGELLAVRRVPASLEATLPPSRVLARTDEEAVRAATRDAHRVSVLHLVPDAIRAARAAAARRFVRIAGVAAAALLILSAGVNLWGERRELESLRARRAQHAAAVRATMLLQDTLTGATDRIGAIAGVDARAERWSAVIAQVAGALPPDAYLTAFRAEADSVSLEGQATNAAGVFAAMRTAPGIMAVRATAPVRQEGGAGQPVVERFLLGARVDPRSALGGQTP